MSEEASAYTHRDAAYALMISTVWEDSEEDAEHIEWTRELSRAIKPYSTGGVYVNFLDDDDDERVKSAYGAEKFERLVELKNKYDPANVFRLNGHTAVFSAPSLPSEARIVVFRHSPIVKRPDVRRTDEGGGT